MNRHTETHPFFERLNVNVRSFGGLFNAHLHLDRAGTLDDRYMRATGHGADDSSHLSLARKHSLIGVLHAGLAYERDDLRRRVHHWVDQMVAVGTRRADTLVDVTDDGVGLTALEWLQEIQTERRGDLELRIGAYSPLGFRDDEPGRWNVYAEGAERADFIASLPEADDVDDYPEHIGFREHLRRVLELATRSGKMLHVHTDQRHEASESGTEQLVEAVREFGAPRSDDGEPMVWAIHVVSPSTYDEARFQRMLAGLVETDVGIIVCPSAALGMRQLRPLSSPTGNSIPRVLEMLAAGVRVRLGCDNVADMCSPSTTADLFDEVFALSAALRFYQPKILARLACGQRLAEDERAMVRDHLEHDRQAVADTVERLKRRAALAREAAV